MPIFHTCTRCTAGWVCLPIPCLSCRYFTFFFFFFLIENFRFIFYSIFLFFSAAAYYSFQLRALCQYGVGFFTFFYPKASQNTRASFLSTHVWFGIVVFILLMATLCSGLMNKQRLVFKGDNTYSPSMILLNTIGVLVVLGGVAVTYLLSPASTRADMHKYEPVNN